MKAADVVVVGGGVIGLAVAWRAAAGGLSTVVVDPNPGRGASWAAAGMLAPVTEATFGEDDLRELNLASAQRWPAFAEDVAEASGADIGYRRCGTLTVARDADDNAVLARLFGYQRDVGLDVTRLPARECRALEPALSPRVRGGILAADDHQVDNRALVGALRTACERAGVQILAHRAARLCHQGDRVRGVAVDNDSSIDAALVVLAAGADSAGLAGVPPQAVPPVRPVKGQLLHLRGPAEPPLLSRTVRGLDVYLVPRADGRLVVGATVEERGADRRVTGGGVYELLRDALELVPGVDELELAETVTGLRPGSPDNAPLLGPTVLDGLVAATGHYRNGVLLAPVTADAIAQVLVEGTVPELIAPFSPQRFAEAATLDV